MNMEEELVRLRGRVAATQMIVVGLCLELRKYNAEGEHLVASAFSYADRAIGSASDPDRQVRDDELDAALASLEQLGNAALNRASPAVNWSAEGDARH